jgi:hypothetical protein
MAMRAWKRMENSIDSGGLRMCSGWPKYVTVTMYI